VTLQLRRDTTTNLATFRRQLVWPGHPDRYRASVATRCIWAPAGRRYWLLLADFLAAGAGRSLLIAERIYPGGLRRYQLAGHVQLIQRGPVLEIAELILWPAHRGRGVGTVLLGAVIALAREQGSRSVDAHIVAQEGRDPDRLRAWYGRQGFAVDEDWGRLRL